MQNPVQWKIRISGYGTFEFTGTEEKAEEMRIHKAQLEHGSGIKWRTNPITEIDHLTAEMAILWDEGKSIPWQLCRKLKKAQTKLGQAS